MDPQPSDQVGIVTPFNSRQTALVVFASCFSALAVLVVVLRWGLLIKRRRRPMFSDWIALPALTLTLASAVTSIMFAVYGSGQAISYVRNVDPGNIALVTKWSIAGDLFWLYATVLAKTSLLFLYMSLFPGKTCQRACIGTIASLVVFAIASTLGIVLECIPLDVLWDGTPTGKCEAIGGFEVATGAIGILFDIVIIVIPQSTVWGLRVPKARRLSIQFLFSFGLLVIIVAIARIVSIGHAYWGSAPGTWTRGDFMINLTVFLETVLSSIGANLPTLGPLALPTYLAFRRAISLLTAPFRSIKDRFMGGNHFHAQSQSTSTAKDIANWPVGYYISDGEGIGSRRRSWVAMTPAEVERNGDMIENRNVSQHLPPRQHNPTSQLWASGTQQVPIIRLPQQARLPRLYSGVALAAQYSK